MKRIRQAASRERVARNPTTVFPHDRGRALGADHARGEPLPGQIRSVMEPRFAHDFARVRIHADAGADSMARALDARAVTVDEHVYFRDGAFDRGDLGSVHLLAHELAHVAQNAQVGGAEDGLSERSDASEQNARAAADAALEGDPISVGGAAPAAVARDEGEGADKEYESPFGRAADLGEAPGAMGGPDIPGLDYITKPLAAVGGLDNAMHADSGLGAASGLMSGAGSTLELAAKIGEEDLGEVAGKIGGVGGLVGAGSSALDAVRDFSAGKTGQGALDTTKSVSGALSGLGGIGGFSLAESGGMSAAAALGGEGLSGMAALGPWGAVLGAGLAGWGVGTELNEHTSVGEHTQGALGGIDSLLTGDDKTPWSLRTSDAMSDDFSKGNLSSLSGVGNYAKGVGNALELGAFGLGGALAGLGGGEQDAMQWAGGKVGEAGSAVGGGLSNAAGWLRDKL
jgi:hypothetical protein